jgi:cephalosporin hydroxylase
MVDNFYAERSSNISKASKDKELKELSIRWVECSSKYNYSYNYEWLGRPIIQFPPDMIAIQEIIWKIKPDLIIETGIARGGSLIYYASLLELINPDGLVLGIDIDIREHNRDAIVKHPMNKRIKMIEGSSIDPNIIKQVKETCENKKSILIILDSNHSHDHVLNELRSYSSFVTLDSYMIVLDTIVEDLPDGFVQNRPWGKGNNPKTAVWEFLKTNKTFKIDKDIENKLLISVAPDGYLKCIK